MRKKTCTDVAVLACSMRCRRRVAAASPGGAQGAAREPFPNTRFLWRRRLYVRAQWRSDPWRHKGDGLIIVPL
jgi:hypothetical protein